MTTTQVAARRSSVEVRANYNPRAPHNINVGQADRLFSVLGGSGLVLYGLVRGKLLPAALGGLLCYRGITGHSFLYKMLDITTVDESPDAVAPVPDHRSIKLRRSVTIERSPEDLYRFWRQSEQAPSYRSRVVSVTWKSRDTSHWVAHIPPDRTLEWDEQIIEDIPARLITWRTRGKSLSGLSGRVRFEPVSADRGTLVTLELEIPVVSGFVSKTAGKLLAKLPEQQMREDLRHFKELMEAGEVPSIKGQPTGQGRK